MFFFVNNYKLSLISKKLFTIEIYIFSKIDRLDIKANF